MFTRHPGILKCHPHKHKEHSKFTKHNTLSARWNCNNTPLLQCLYAEVTLTLNIDE